MYQLAEAGCRVKATGFGRVDFDPLPVLKKLHAINETCLLFGTDLPSTRAKVPFSEKVPGWPSSIQGLLSISSNLCGVSGSHNA